MSPVLRRADTVLVDDSDHDGWWFSDTAIIIKWSVLGAITLFFFVWLVGGYFHARRRIRKGLRPLAYHRFLVPAWERGTPPPGPQNNFTFYRVQNDGYNMNPMQPPPPAYDPNAAIPPNYYPPEGASKLDPNQSYDAPPPGQPQSQQPPRSETIPNELPPREPKQEKWINKINPLKRK